MIVLGIDPGLTGGIAILRGASIEVHDIPIAGKEINPDALLEIVRNAKADLAVIERSQAYPGQGSSSGFKYGVAVGMLRMAVAFCAIPQHLVSPNVWKKHFGLNSDKEAARALAIRLWPGCGYFNRKKDHGRSEACLLARYGLEKLVKTTGETL